MGKIRLGVSACLLGQRVRFDGQHKQNLFLTKTLGQFVEYVPVCPEVECGLPTPREAMRLTGVPGEIRLLTQKTRQDFTGRMNQWAIHRLRDLKKEQLCGFVFKSKSPSCGLSRVKTFHPDGHVSGHSAGLFAQKFTAAFPLLPTEEEGRLNDPALRKNFIERLFAMKRYRDAISQSRSIKTLTDFHAAHKYLLMAHSPAACHQMGKLLSSEKNQINFDRLVSEYELLLMKTLRLLATVKKHNNVLMHMMGYLKKCITPDEKKELLETLEIFRQELVPLSVPLTLLKHYVRKYNISYLGTQVYLNPHPLELTRQL